MQKLDRSNLIYRKYYMLLSYQKKTLYYKSNAFMLFLFIQRKSEQAMG